MKQIFLVCIVFAFMFGQKPSATEAKTFVEYFENGKEAVLYHVQLTSDVKDLEPVDQVSSIGKNGKISVWMKFVVPKETEDTSYEVRYLNDKNQILKTKILELKTKQFGSMRYRTWVTQSFSESGQYRAEIYYNGQQIQSINFTVTEEEAVSESN